MKFEKFKTKAQCKQEQDALKTNGKIKLSEAIFEGGLGYGKICIPTSLSDFVMMILYPPAYIFFVQKDQDFANFWQIVISFFLTSLFYFPGLIHALYTKYNYKCGSVLSMSDNI
jgi:uncharacterized membrane protein YqaE (UPF0057 family)